MKKALVILMALVMVIGVFAGCGTTAEPTKAPTKAPTATTAPSGGSTAATATPAPAGDGVDRSEKIDIEYWNPIGSSDQANKRSLVEEHLEEKFNMNLTNNVTGSEEAAYSLMFASGDYPDIFEPNLTPQYIYIENKLSRLIPTEWFETYCPLWAEQYELLGTLKTMSRVPGDPDNMYFLSGVSGDRGSASKYWYADFYRYDWIENLGIDVGVGVEEVYDRLYCSSEALTLEKHLEIMQKFTENDPDGDGKNDTLGVIADTGMWYTYCIGSAFDMVIGNDGLMLDKDTNEGTWYAVSNNYKDYLEKYVTVIGANKWADPETQTDDRQKFWDKAKAEYGGYWGVTAEWLATWASGRPPLNVLTNIEYSKIMMTPGLKSIYTGEWGSKDYSIYPNWQKRVYFHKDMDDNTLKRCLEMHDYAMWDPYIREVAAGEEGVNWVWIDGKVVVIAGDIGIFEDENVVGTCTPLCNGNSSLENVNYDPDPIWSSTWDYTMGTDAIWVQHMEHGFPYKVDVNWSTDAAAIWSEISANVDTIRSEYYWDIFNGYKVVADTWDAYIQAMQDAGIQTWIDELETNGQLYEDVFYGRYEG